jgi:hypothetical protein
MATQSLREFQNMWTQLPQRSDFVCTSRTHLSVGTVPRAPGRPGDRRMPQGSGLRRLSHTVGRLQQGFTIGGKGSDGHFAWQQSSGANVRFGSIADMRGTILNDNRQRFLIPARNRMAVRILSACAASAACGASACAVFCAARTTLSRSTAGPLGKL